MSNNYGMLSLRPLFFLSHFYPVYIIVNSLPNNITNSDLLAISVTEVNIEYNDLGLKPLKRSIKTINSLYIDYLRCFLTIVETWLPQKSWFRTTGNYIGKRKTNWLNSHKNDRENELCMNHVFQDKILTFKIDRSLNKK